MVSVSCAFLTIWWLLIMVNGEEDWATCTPCRCSWVNGRKNADCKKSPGTVLHEVPANLSSEIRSIDFTDQQFYELKKYAFQSNNLRDLQKIKLVNCRLTIIDKFAFAKMQLLIELDISRNNISKLDVLTFRDNKRLRVVRLNDNKIERLDDGLFTNLTFLQRVELNNNRIAHVGKHVFINATKLQYLMLNSNRLKYMSTSIIENLQSLSSLSLHNNSWICDCHLKTFSNYTVHRNLFTLPTECEQPERLRKRSWSELSLDDFACRPNITEFPTRVVADSENVTLSCKVEGNPRPDVNWLYRNAIIDTTRRQNSHRYNRNSDFAGRDTYWFNLTIIGVDHRDAGEYRCNAKNPGGEQERNITLIVNYNRAGVIPLPGGGVTDTWTLVLFIILAVVIIALLVTLVLWCCVCRRRNVRHTKGNSLSPNGDISLEGTGGEMEKSLITAVNPVEKPPRQYPPSMASGVTEVSEVNRTLLDSDSVFVAGDNDSRMFDFEQTPRKSQNLLDSDQMQSDRPYPPDLLSFPARGYQVSPAGSYASTIPDHSRLPPQHGPQSPVHSPPFDTSSVYRTLPYSRSHSPFTAPLNGPVIVPRANNKGYVTMPRRNRVPSWSSAPPTSPLVAEPVYDNLGLRTTAEGSSMLSLNKAVEVTPRPRPLVTSASSYQQSMAKCLPIDETMLQHPDAHSAQNLSLDSPSMVIPKRDSVVRMTPEGSNQVQSTPEIDTRRLSSASLASVPEGRKIPPRPPPKPKKSITTGPLFEDEGEDGTEV